VIQVTNTAVGLLQIVPWDRIQEQGKVKRKFAFHILDEHVAEFTAK
jgi:hypothetical protein